MKSQVLALGQRPPRRIAFLFHQLRWLAALLLVSTSWTLAQDTATVTLQLPLPRMGHTLSLRQWDPGLNGYGSSPLVDFTVTHQQDDGTGAMVPTASSFLQASGNINLYNDFFVVDESTGETGPLNLSGTPSFQRTSFLSTPWYSDGVVASSFFMTLPADRSGHVFTLFSQGVSYLVSTGSVLGYSTTDSNGQPIIQPYGFFDGWVTTGPGGLYFLVDQSVSEQSNTRPVTDRNFLSNTTWSGFSGALPTRLLSIWLPESEGYNMFGIHSQEGSLSWVSPQYDSGYDSNGTYHSGWKVSAAIGVNQNFTLVREVDGVSFAGSIGIEDLSVDATSAFSPYSPPPPPEEPPYQPNWQTVTVQVGQDHWSESIILHGSNGDWIYPVADWTNQGFLAAYDVNGIEYYRYYYVTFTATVDANYTYTAQDSGGHTSLMDGFNPPPAYVPNNQGVSVQVGENHWSDSIYAFLPNGQSVLMTADWSTVGAQTAVDSWGNTYYTYQYVNFVATIDINQGYAVANSAGETNFMDGFNPPYIPNYQTVSIQVGENHWGDTIQFTLGDNTTVNAAADTSTQGYQAAYDWSGVEYYRYNYVNYVATFDVNLGYTISDSAGHTSFMDGFNPPALPPLPTASVQVGEDHWGHSIQFHLSDGSTVNATADWSTQGYQAAFDALGNPYYYYNWVNYTLTLTPSQSFYYASDDLGHTSLMDGFNPPPPPEIVAPVYLKIAASRWQHTLVVRTSSGDEFPVVADQMQGFWTVDQTNQSWWSSYYFFNASSSFRSGQNWWVYDVTMGDTAPLNTNDLSSTWSSPDAYADDDGDGLVNWYEALIGTNPGSVDTDGDGMGDAWEIAHHFNATLDDGSADADGDGWTNLQEYLMGTDLRRGTVRVNITSPADAIFTPGN